MFINKNINYQLGTTRKRYFKHGRCRSLFWGRPLTLLFYGSRSQSAIFIFYFIFSNSNNQKLRLVNPPPGFLQYAPLPNLIFFIGVLFYDFLIFTGVFSIFLGGCIPPPTTQPKLVIYFESFFFTRNIFGIFSPVFHSGKKSPIAQIFGNFGSHTHLDIRHVGSQFSVCFGIFPLFPNDLRFVINFSVTAGIFGSVCS